MVKLLFTLSLAALLIASCGNETKPPVHFAESTPDTLVAIDSVPADTVPVELLATTMHGDTIEPADQSEVFYSFSPELFQKKGKLLSAKEVKKRFMPLDPECDPEFAYKLRRYFTLDSINKAGGTASGYMGQMVWAEIHLMDTIRKDENGCWVTWKLAYKTEDACPYAAGTLYLLSTYNAAGKNISTQCMARDEGGADAPISWTCHEYCNIFKDGSFRSLYADTTEDYDIDGKADISVMRKTFTGQISTAGKITRTELEIERSE